GERCAVAAGPLAGNLNSWQVARDMDAVRAAVGERELNYYGNSYGTMFAQAYAEFFPNRVGRMYLDSVIDHTRTSIRQWLKPRAETEERGLHRFAEWCAADAGCALHGQEVLQVWDEVMARAERDPIPAPGAGPGVTVDPSTIASRAHTTFPDIWAPLAQALADARNGDATWFTVVGGARDPDLSRIMFCGDFPYPTEYPEVKQLENELRRIAPRIGWRSAWPMANHCAGLPKTGTFPQHPFRTAGLPPILVVNGDHDSTTPPEDGRHLVAQWPGARYLRVPAGHAVYFSGNPCVRGHVHRYLTTGVLPAAGTVCAAD
ncbi:MAG: alpha/beta hydrolase, partial [Kibdelosporangium sp.]